jgi:CDP-diglyceride synthetase
VTFLCQLKFRTVTVMLLILAIIVVVIVVAYFIGRRLGLIRPSPAT